MSEKENLLDHVGYREKWHGTVQNFRKPAQFNQNDPLIEEIFKRLKIKNGLFVEFGAWDGIANSNTRKLFLDGWSGILIEPNRKRYEELEKNYEDSDHVHCINSYVDHKNNLFDDIVGKYVVDKIDFCSIDIDGLDLEVFETIEKFLPEVVCIEGGQMLSPVFKERLPTHTAKDNIQQGIYVMN